MGRTITVVATPAAESKSVLGKQAEAAWTEVDFDKLKANLEKMTQDLGELFEATEKPKGYGLTKITVGLEVSAQGGVSLIGTLNAGAKAAITLTFEKTA